MSTTYRMKYTRRSLAVLTGLLAVAAAVPAVSASPGTAPHLPEPTGPHPVGTTSVYLNDVSRPDPWVPEATARELMVSLWYPAKSAAGRRAQYMTPTESELILKEVGITGVPPDVLSTTRTNAVSGATPAGRARGWPLVVLSPGFTEPRSSLTALAEELASRGYVVTGIEHTYESIATAFPDGRVTTCVACELDQTDGFREKLRTARAADASFVLDELTGSHPRWSGARLIDPSRIAMAGHSVGGAGAIEAMLTDSRVRAGINMDGTTFESIPDGGLSRPFLFLGSQAKHSPGGDGTWDRDWTRLTGWKRWLVVAGAEHASFTDTLLLLDQLDVYHNPDLSAARSLQIVRACTRAFFDRHLRNTPQPLLDRPSARYPEVKFCTGERCGERSR